jgi:hypothetical protein
MPYINKSARINFDKHLNEVGPHTTTKGDLNYCVTHLVLMKIKR